jgi:hypothetical protein
MTPGPRGAHRPDHGPAGRAGTSGRPAVRRLALDPRVQIADFLAGVARKVASDELDGRGDAELVALLRTYVDPASVWGDDRSWSVLRPR